VRDLESQLADANRRAASISAEARGEAGGLKVELDAAREALAARGEELRAAKEAWEARL
jgi:hypothetical protein